MRYEIKQELTIPAKANPRYEDLSFTEYNRRGCRIIGGDLGDVEFSGFTVRESDTVLASPVLISSLEFNEDEVFDIAQNVVMESFASIGVECVEHS